MVQTPIRSVYKDGSIVISNVKSKIDNTTTSYTVVNTWHDSTPMDDSKVDQFGIYSKYKPTGEYLRENKPQWGEKFLEVDTVAELRAMTPYNQFLLRIVYFKGVRLSGYYVKGDTSLPIDYKLTNISIADNGGTVFNIGNIKLLNDLEALSNPKYFGCGFSENVEDITPFFKAYKEKFPEYAFIEIKIEQGKFKILETIDMPSNFKMVSSSLVEIVSDGVTGLYFKDKTGISITDIKLGVINPTETTFCIYCLNCTLVRINEIELFKGVTGIRIEDSQIVYFNTSWIHDMDFWGVYILNCSEVFVNDITAHDNGRDGIKIAGQLSRGVPKIVKNVSLTFNKCFGNGRDGIDVAINHIDGFTAMGNICRDNLLEGLDFKILAYTEGSAKNVAVGPNQFIDNGNRGMNIQNDIPELAIFQGYFNGNIITGGENLNTINRYAVTIMVGNLPGTKVDLKRNDISNYENGVRVNNTLNANVATNDISVRYKGIHLLNGLAINKIDRAVLESNKIKYSSTSGVGIDVGGVGELIGEITNTETFSNIIQGTGTGRRIIKNPSATFSKYYGNIIGEYSGLESSPSFAANKNDIVKCTEPITKMIDSWIAYQDQELNERKYYGQGIIDKYALLNRKGNLAEAPALGSNDDGYQYWHNTNKYPLFWTGNDWAIGVLARSGIWLITTGSILTNASATFSKVDKQVAISGSLTFSTADTEVLITLPYAPDYGFSIVSGILTFIFNGGSSTARVISTSVASQSFQITYKTA